ncbi:hypothetical protein Syun_008941 [Stephania yunnanensis]|uniref:Uncharacterized protein n=1 Tax=Stephania yunnanensis TaxID=152371 RepID=A0AAP0KG29_9MAGN
MVAVRPISLHRLCESLRLQNTSNPLFTPTHQPHLSLCSIFQRNFSDNAQLDDGHVRLIKTDEEIEGFGEESIKLKSISKGRSKPNSVCSLFSSKSETSNAVSEKYSTEKRKSQSLGGLRPVAKELSPEMVSLISRFYEEGLLNDANFLPLKKLELSDLSNPYYRDFLMFTAERFGQDHQEVAKWLSGSHLKKVALFGCPSVEKKTTYAAKRLRSFFSIHEDTDPQLATNNNDKFQVSKSQSDSVSIHKKSKKTATIHAHKVNEQEYKA